MEKKALGEVYMPDTDVLSVRRPFPAFFLLKKTKTNKPTPGSHVAQAGLSFPMQPKITRT